jgi:Tol biopolymer transport system component
MTFEDRLRDALRAAAGSAEPPREASDPRSAVPRVPSPSPARRVAIVVGALGLSALTVAMLMMAFDDRGDPGRSTPGGSRSTTAATPVAGLTVECSHAGASVDPGEVELARDGVSVHLVTSSAGTLFVVRRADDPRQESSVFDVGPGSESDVSVQLEPAVYEVACAKGDGGSITTADIPQGQFTARFTLTDPHGYWPQIQADNRCGGPLPAPLPTAGTDAPLVTPVEGRMLVNADSGPTYDDQIYSVAADGSEATQLTEEGRNWGARWSPDGSKIAYAGDHFNDITSHTTFGGHTEIYTARSDGRDVQQVTNDTSDADDMQPVWSPDGQRLLFTSNRGGPTDLWMANADGSGLTEIDLPNTIEYAESPAWSPDGAWIAFVGFPKNDTATPCTDGELFVVRPGGSELRQLTDDGLYQQYPTWSPDGTRLAYVASDQSDYSWEVFTMAADGSDVRRLTDSPAYESAPLWSPDGQLITFVSDRLPDGSAPGGDGGSPGPLSQYVMNADGSGVRELFDAVSLGMRSDVDAVTATDWRA